MLSQQYHSGKLEWVNGQIMRGMRNVISLAYYHSHYFFCFAVIYVNFQLHLELLFLFMKKTNSTLILCSEYKPVHNSCQQIWLAIHADLEDKILEFFERV